MKISHPHSERRRFQRITLQGSVHIYTQQQSWSGRILDISLKGVLVSHPQDCQTNTQARYRIDLRVHDSIVVSMGAILTRFDDRCLAFSWDRIDLDSFSRLKRLIELHSSHPDLLNRELSRLG